MIAKFFGQKEGKFGTRNLTVWKNRKKALRNEKKNWGKFSTEKNFWKKKLFIFTQNGEKKTFNEKKNFPFLNAFFQFFHTVLPVIFFNEILYFTVKVLKIIPQINKMEEELELKNDRILKLEESYSIMQKNLLEEKLTLKRQLKSRNDTVRALTNQFRLEFKARVFFQ